MSHDLRDVSIAFPGASVSDPVEEALARVAGRGVSVVRWPGSPTPDRSTEGRAVLYVVDPGAEPPWCDELADWIRRPVALSELHARADRLVARLNGRRPGSVAIDEDDVLRIDRRRVILSPLEARLLRVLLDEAGRVVTRDQLARAVWPEGPPTDPRALDNRVKVTRARLGGAPLRIHTVRGRGFLLETAPEVAAVG